MIFQSFPGHLRFYPLTFLLYLESRIAVPAATDPAFLEVRPLLEEVEKMA